MKSLEELKVIRDRMQSQIGPRCGAGETAPEHVEGDGPEKFIMVCGGTGCHSGHSQEVMDRFEKLIKVAGKEKEYKVIQTGCQGLCAKGPIVVIHPGAVFYEEVNPDKAEVIFREHVEGGNVASKYLLREENADGTNDEDFKFYNRQTRIALRNCGMIDPENIDEYIGRGGYEALGRSLTQMSPDDVIQVVLDSGLRGRGGAGFPTNVKLAPKEPDKIDYILVNETPLESLRSTFAINMFLLVLILILSTITIIFLISAFTRLITTPLEYLSERMQHVELGDLKVRSNLKQNDEIGDISNNFNTMVHELEKLTAQIKQDERQKRKYELSLMQAQINPHFFYNVLDLIYISCYQKQEKQAATVTKYLADYYRCVLSNGKELIPIREEFRMLQNYLLIQRYRYATILDFQIEAEPEAENYIIPKMTLQPLVENSLYHGIKEKTSPGIITIISRVRTDHITLCVCDNGVGMEQAKLRRYLNSPEAEDHFGLKSVYNRLFLYYNNKCKFRIFSQKDTGTAVVICIPKNWEEL